MSDASPVVALLLASPAQRWGPVLGAITVIDVVVVLIAVAAAARGWQLGLTRLALGAAGLLAGAWAGLWAGSHLVPAGLSVGVGLALAVALVIAGALIASGIGAAIGARAGAGLGAMHLRAPDRAAGAIARAALAVALCWLLVAGVAAFAPPAPAAAAAALTERSAVLRAVSELTPSVDDLGRRVAEHVPLAGALVAMVPERAALDRPALRAS